MKTLVNALSSAVRRAPLAVIIVTVVLSLVLGGLSGEFQPEEDSNESFAPEAPELAAADRISELFGSDSTTSVMQIIITAESGNVFSLDGLAAAQTIEETVRTGAFADVLAEPDDPELAAQQPAVISYLTPVLAAIGQGQPAPTSDAEVQQYYLAGLE